MITPFFGRINEMGLAYVAGFCMNGFPDGTTGSADSDRPPLSPAAWAWSSQLIGKVAMVSGKGIHNTYPYDSPFRGHTTTNEM